MKRIIVLALISFAFVVKGNCQLTVSSGSQSGSIVGPQQSDIITIVGSGVIYDVRATFSGSGANSGVLTVFIDGVNYSSGGLGPSNTRYMPPNRYGAWTATTPTVRKGIEFKTGFVIRAWASQCSSCSTSGEVTYQLD